MHHSRMQHYKKSIKHNNTERYYQNNDTRLWWWLNYCVTSRRCSCPNSKRGQNNAVRLVTRRRCAIVSMSPLTIGYYQWEDGFIPRCSTTAGDQWPCMPCSTSKTYMLVGYQPAYRLTHISTQNLLDEPRSHRTRTGDRDTAICHYAPNWLWSVLGSAIKLADFQAFKRA